MSGSSESMEEVCPFAECGWWCWSGNPDQLSRALKQHLQREHVLSRDEQDAYHRGYHDGWKEARQFSKNLRLRFWSQLKFWFYNRSGT